MRLVLLILPLAFSCDRNAELLPSADGGVASAGAACTSSCAADLTCYAQLPDGFCSKPCGTTSDCPSGTVCGQLDDVTFICLPVCNLSTGMTCRDGYSCCPDHLPPTTGPGACAPAGSSYCGG